MQQFDWMASRLLSGLFCESPRPWMELTCRSHKPGCPGDMLGGGFLSPRQRVSLSLWPSYPVFAMNHREVTRCSPLLIRRLSEVRWHGQWKGSICALICLINELQKNVWSKVLHALLHPTKWPQGNKACRTFDQTTFWSSLIRQTKAHVIPFHLPWQWTSESRPIKGCEHVLQHCD